ncbi:hypothetical protein FACS1894170_07610 [Planctomycetales bacterium]|nr:hypothetical protein FACS1894170_07610 [Planctomycetales bacterium]
MDKNDFNADRGGTENLFTVPPFPEQTMIRYSVFTVISTLIAVSTGCKMCCSPYDYCIPAVINRADDYRGCGPLYRAGSVFHNADCKSCAGDNTGNILLTSNAGNYGRTVPVSAAVTDTPGQIGPNLPFVEPKPIDRPTIAKPPAVEPQQPIDIDLTNPFEGQPLPAIDDYLLQKSAPITPPKTGIPIPQQLIPNIDQPLSTDGDTIPFVESDAFPPVQNQYQPNLSSGEPVITIEELKKLDPEATDIKILNVEDSAVTP